MFRARLGALLVAIAPPVAVYFELCVHFPIFSFRGVPSLFAPLAFLLFFFFYVSFPVRLNMFFVYISCVYIVLLHRVCSLPFSALVFLFFFYVSFPVREKIIFVYTTYVCNFVASPRCSLPFSSLAFLFFASCFVFCTLKNVYTYIFCFFTALFSPLFLPSFSCFLRFVFCAFCFFLIYCVALSPLTKQTRITSTGWMSLCARVTPFLEGAPIPSSATVSSSTAGLPSSVGSQAPLPTPSSRWGCVRY